MTVAYAIVKQECSQATDGWTMDGLLTPCDLENRSKSWMIEVVQELHIRTLCFQFDGCSSSHSQTRVFTSHKQTDGWMGGDPLTPDDLRNSSMSYMSELVEGLHSKNVCFQFDHCSSSHSHTRVFTRHKSVTNRKKMVVCDLESRSRSCMIELVQGLHKSCLHTWFGVSSFSHSQTRVFTRHKSVTDRNKMATSDLETSPRSCMIELVQGLHKRCLHTWFGV